MVENFSQRMGGQIDSARQWANNLKFKRALIIVLSSPLYFLGWLTGRFWFGLKYLAGLLVVGFRAGSGTGGSG